MWGYRVLSYIDDFLVAPSVGRAASGADCCMARELIGGLMRDLGLARHPTKGVWNDDSTVVEQVQVVVEGLHRGVCELVAAVRKRLGQRPEGLGLRLRSE